MGADNEANATLEYWAQQDAEEAAEEERRAMWDLHDSESEEEEQAALTSTDVHVCGHEELTTADNDVVGDEPVGYSIGKRG